MNVAKKMKQFAVEADLCAAFIAALPKGWTSYAETGGWDILLVRDVDGFQIGVEAKLKFNAIVLQQSLKESRWGVMDAGPDCRAVLVPSGEGNLGALADYIGVTVIQTRVHGVWGAPAFVPSLPDEKRPHSTDHWHEWCPAKRHKLPAYVPDVAAGNPAPIQLTDWKIKALKLIILAERQGFVTRADFKFLGLDHRRWITAEGWLRPGTERGHYIIYGQPPIGLKTQHPRVYVEIEADAAKWMPPTKALIAGGYISPASKGAAHAGEPLAGTRIEIEAVT